MKKIRHKNLQRQIHNLIPIVELCLPFIKEVDQTQGILSLFPAELERLKEQAEVFKFESSYGTNNLNLELKIDETEFHLDSIVDDLDRILVHLTMMERNLKNLLVIREKLEAIQEERIDGITPERIYKLLEKQQHLAQNSENLRLNKEPKVKYWHQKWRQKATNFYQNFNNTKTAMSLAIVTSLFLGWIAGYYSGTNAQLTKNIVIEKTEKVDKS